MILKVSCEFRGKSERITEEGKHYYYCNLEDEFGESCKFQTVDNLDLSKLKKGDKVTAELEFNSKYGSLKVYSLEVTK